MQPVKAFLPKPRGEGFAPETLLAPRQALVAYFARVRTATPRRERVRLDDAGGRVLARSIEADDDYPNAARSAMDGFAVAAGATPGTFAVAGDVRMGEMPDRSISLEQAMRVPTGGVLPLGADAVVPVEEAQLDGARVRVLDAVTPGTNVVARGADMQRGERVLRAGVRIAAPQAGVLATLGVTDVDVYRRPVIAVLSSGDELIPAERRPAPGQVRDSNRYAIAASLRAMGAQPRHFPKLADEPAAFERALSHALAQCDAVVISGGSSVGDRDQLPAAVAALGEPGIVVHGLRLKPGKPTLLGAVGGKPIVGLPGNPLSALTVLEAVAAPIVGALVGAPAVPAQLSARLTKTATSRLGWTWFVPVALEHDGEAWLAHPLAVRSFSVSLAARADGYIVMDERDDAWSAGTPVTVVRFLGTT